METVIVTVSDSGRIEGSPRDNGLSIWEQTNFFFSCKPREKGAKIDCNVYCISVLKPLVPKLERSLQILLSMILLAKSLFDSGKILEGQ
jgi:hypothetical protein